MRRALLLAAACAASLVIAAPGSGRSRTTNAPAIFSVKVTLTDTSIALRPNRAARGSTVTFILTNRGRKTHTFLIGDVKRGVGYTQQGFARTLKPNQQFTIVMYLDLRGTLTYFNRTGTKPVARGSFRVT
jgi:hypothetical protein